MENGFLLLNLTIILLLLAVTIWDTITLTNEYLYNNRMTLVRPQYATDDYPFLRDERLQIVVMYENVMFPEMWHASLKADWNKQLERYSEMARNFSVGFDLEKIQTKWLNKTWTIKQKMIFGTLLAQLADMDDAFIECVVLSRSLCEKFKKREFSHLDTPLKNYPILEELESKLWVSKGISLHGPPLVRSTYSGFNINRAMIDVNLSAMLSTKLSVAPVYVGFFVPPSLLFDNTHEISGSLWIQASTVAFPRLPAFTLDRTSALTKITLSITNTAIFDRRQTTACIDEPTLLYRLYMGDSECHIRNYFVALAEKCRCIPHSYWKEYARLSGKYTYLPMPRCDSAMYESYREEMEHTSFLNCDTPKCIVVKNQLSYFVDTSEAEDICELLNDTCAPIRIELRVSDNFYTYYEEQFQFSGVQFFSQLGGDWGLYTGVSVISVWQLFVFLYQKYRDYKSGRSISPKQETEQKDVVVKAAWHDEPVHQQSTPWWKHARNEINEFMGIKPPSVNDEEGCASTMKQILLEMKESRKEFGLIRQRLSKLEAQSQI